MTIHEVLQKALLHHRGGEVLEAERLYRTVLEQVESPDAMSLLGVLCQQTDRVAEGITWLRQAVEHRPDHGPFHYNLGRALFASGRYAEAVEAYRGATRLAPGHAEAWANLGTCHREIGQWTDAVAAYRRHFQIRRTERPSVPTQRTWMAVTRSKLRHDIEQVAYLANQGLMPASLDGAIDAYTSVLNELNALNPGEDDPVLDLTPEQFSRIEPYYNRALYAPDVAFDGDPVNPALPVEAILHQWRKDSPSICSFDHFLVPEALEALYRWAISSTIWFDCGYQGGYLGAYVEEGFSCTLLIQIAQSLRKRFPALLADHPLRQMWAFKCDPRLTGLGAHADSSAVNLNFWVTPDTANRDPEHGGLVVSRVKAPPEWGYDTYNSAEGSTRILDYVAAQGEDSLTVPFRRNRAVMFDSDLFHWSDKIDFEPGYVNRRVNITMLFGKRKGLI